MASVLKVVFKEDLRVIETDVFHLDKASLSYWSENAGEIRGRKSLSCFLMELESLIGSACAEGGELVLWLQLEQSTWWKKGNLGCTSQKSLAARKKWQKFENLIPCVEPKTLTIEKGNA